MSETHGSPYRVGVTSSLAAGKSTFLSVAQSHGFNVIDTDKLTHEILNSPNPAYDKVLATFGADLVDTVGGPIDRARLANVVFKDRAKRKQLELIIHPAVKELCETRIASLPSDTIVFVEIPLLFEANLQKNYDETVALTVTPEIQMDRLLQRPNMNQASANARIEAQLPQQEKARRANHVIDNSSTMEVFVGNLRAYFEQVKQRAANRSNVVETSVDQTKNAPATTEVEVPVPAPADTAAPAPADAVITPPAPAVEPQISEAEIEARGSRFMKMLRDFAAMATGEASDKLGKVGGTKHKEASASVVLDVASCDTSGADKKHSEHELRVDVKMSVKQKNGATTGPCSCGCTNCRAGCACASACGCKCTTPAPVPTPTPVPVPTPTPTPPPTPPPPAPPHNHGGHGPWWRGGAAIVGIVALVVLLLGFLAFLYATRAPVVTNGGGTTTIVMPCGTCTNTCPTPCPAPSPNPTPEPPKPNPTPEPNPVPVPPKPAPTDPCVVVGPCSARTVVPFGSTQAPVGTGCSLGTVADVVTPLPPFAFDTTPNWVRARVTNWKVSYEDGCASARLVGRDAQGNLVTYQQYGRAFAFAYRWDVSYATNRVQVDRFESFNVFVGRTVYVYDSAGLLVQVQQLDNHQRLLTSATLTTNTSGVFVAVFSRYNATTGSFVEAQTYEGDAARKTLSSTFYLYPTFSN